MSLSAQRMLGGAGEERSRYRDWTVCGLAIVRCMAEMRYTIRRLLSGLVNILVISLVCFIVISLPPGDFASALEYELIQSGA